MAKQKNKLLLYTVLTTSAGFILFLVFIGIGAINFSNAPISQGSIVETDAVFVSTNQTAIDDFISSLDSAGLPITERFTVQINSVLFDSDGNQYPKSSFLGLELEKQSLVDDEGHILDLGHVQLGFTGISKSTNRHMQIFGTITFYLDDKQIIEKKIYNKATTTDNKIPLYITDRYEIPTLTDRKTAFTYTFSDESLAQGNHNFKAIIKDIVFNDIATGESWANYNEEVVYNLNLYVDTTKLVVKGSDNKSLEVFKSDNEFKVCAKGVFNGLSNRNAVSSGAIQTPKVTVKINDNEIKTIEQFENNNSKPYPSCCNSVFSEGEPICKSINYPRYSKLNISVEGKEFEVFTPKGRQDNSITCLGTWTSGGTGVKQVCTSTIGYEKQ